MELSTPITFPVYFKQVWTTNTHIIPVNPELTVTEFIELVKPMLSTQFNIDVDELEIIETGSIASETAHPLVSSVKKLRELWGDELKTAAFYVRRKNFEYPQAEHLRQRQIIETTDNCPVCFECTTVTRRFNCIHRVCQECYVNCVSSEITN